MPSQASYVWSTAQEVVADIEHWLRVYENKTLFIRFKQADLLRLTRLKVWSYRYRISVSEILSLILPYLRKTLRTETKKRYGLGVTIAALTGSGAEKILIEAIRQKYPSDEHIAEWREAERTRQLEAEAREERGGLEQKHISGPISLLEADSAEKFLQSYSKRIITRRDRLRAAYSDPERKKLPYRSNPWL